VILYPWFLLLFVVSILSALVIYFSGKSKPEVENSETPGNSVNPLEFRIAIIFTLLFVAFSFITYFTLKQFGTQGLQVLAYIVGVTDIDPFLINLFNGRFGLDLSLVAIATMQAILSNNVLKLVYGAVLSGKECRKLLLIGFGVIILVNFTIICVL